MMDIYDKYIIWGILTIIIFSSCTRRTLHVRPDHATIRIDFDWGENLPPTGTKLFFYNTDENEATVVESSADFFEGIIDEGTYRINIVNNDMVGASVIIENHAERDWIRIAEKTKGKEYMPNIDRVFAAGLSDVIVLGNRYIRKTATMNNLVRKIRVQLDPLNVNDIQSLVIYLTGIIQGRYIHDQSPVMENTLTLSQTGIYNVENNLYEADFSFLGINDNSTIYAFVKYNDGEGEFSLPIDITDILNNNSGDPVRVPLIFPDGSVLELIVIVNDWDNSGTGGGEIPF